MLLCYRYVRLFELHFFLSLVLVTVNSPLLHRQGVSHSFLDVFCYSPLSFWFWPSKRTQIISGWFLFYFSYFWVYCVPSAVLNSENRTDNPCHCPSRNTCRSHMCTLLLIDIQVCYGSELPPSHIHFGHGMVGVDVACKWPTNQNWHELLLFKKEETHTQHTCTTHTV